MRHAPRLQFFLLFMRYSFMKYLTLLAVLFSSQTTFGQSFVFPKLIVQSSSIASIIPKNWKAIDTAYGDLNNDKKEDLVLVLEYNQPIDEVRAYGDADTEIIREFQKPRVLAIYFKNARYQYVFGLQNNNFILRSEEGGAYGEPYQQVTIVDNRLILDFMGGSSWRWQLNYQFKYENKEWLMVKATNSSWDATSGEMNNKEYNFVSKKLIQTTGNRFDSHVKEKVSEKNLNITQLRTFNTFKKPWTWEIEKDGFL
jgi:hypothetical protein